MVVNEVVKRDWDLEQDLLGLARDTPVGQFARGGLAALAVDPTVRIAVLPGDISAHPIPAQEPERYPEGCPARPRLVTARLPLADIRSVLT